MSAPMLVQVSSSNAVSADEALVADVTAKVQRAMARFADRITRIEAHLDDENSSKSGPADKRCTLEVRMAGREPVVVRHNASAIDVALTGALDKLVRAMDRTVEKHRHIKGRDPFDATIR